MKIGAAARAAGLPVKTVRYYADIGLVIPDGRSESGYRQYSDGELRKLIFARHARSFGFSIEQTRELLGLYGDCKRSSSDVKKLANRRLQDIRNRMSELQELHDELAHLVDSCRGDSRPDCPIIASLADSDGSGD